MATRGKYHNQDSLADQSRNGPDAPPSYETISTTKTGQCECRNTYQADEKLTRQHDNTARGGSGVGGTSPVGQTPRSNLNPSIWLSKSSSPSPGTSNQVRETVLTLVRDLVLNAESPNILDSCANACRTYCLDLSTLLQEPFIENHSAIYWAIVKNRDALFQSLLVHAPPFSQSTISEIRLACLIAGNQNLFQSLRCKPGSKLSQRSQGHGQDALLLGSMPADEVKIHEGHGTFVAEMQINLWQKRLRVSSLVLVEFIAQGRIWCLSFSSPPSSRVVGLWRVGLQLLEHSPPTFVDSTLVISLPPPSSSLSTPSKNASQTSNLISLSPPPDNSRMPTARSTPPSSSVALSHQPKSTSKASPQTIELHLNSTRALAYRESNFVEQWMDNGCTYTNAIIIPLVEDAGAELLYDNTPFVAMDGTLYARLEARLEKPDGTESSYDDRGWKGQTIDISSTTQGQSYTESTSPNTPAHS